MVEWPTTALAPQGRGVDDITRAEKPARSCKQELGLHHTTAPPFA
jgi:hypothetical protein